MDIDGVKFSNFTRDAQLLNATTLSMPEMDHIFLKQSDKATRRMDFAQFLSALSIIAQRLYPKIALSEQLSKLFLEKLILSANTREIWIEVGDSLPPLLSTSFT